MALTNCPECGRQVSTEAHACPSCGYPVARKLAAPGAAEPGATQTTSGEQQLLTEVRPSWWGYFWHLFFFFLIVPPIIAIFQRASTVMRIYPSRLTIERGILSKCYQDYNLRDIRSIDVDQRFLQRVVGIGDLTISTSATVEAAEKMRSIPDPRGIRDLIIAQRAGK